MVSIPGMSEKFSFGKMIGELLRPEKPEYLSRFESQASRFVIGITPGAHELLLDAGELRLWHVGQETRHKPGLGTAPEPSGREAAFLEFKQGGLVYHLFGAIDREVNGFEFSGMRVSRDRGFRKIRVDAEVVRSVTDMLSGIPVEGE